MTKVTVSVATIDYLHSAYGGCSGWVSSPYFPIPSGSETYANYSIEAPYKHVSSELE